MKKITIDTNILVYYINKSGEFNKQATDILQNSEYQKYITTKTISEFFVVMTKYKVEWNNIIKYIEELTDISTIIYPTQNSLDKLKELCIKHKPDFREINEITILEDCK